MQTVHGTVTCKKEKTVIAPNWQARTKAKGSQWPNFKWIFLKVFNKRVSMPSQKTIFSVQAMEN